ncbi:MAG: hypothetical protein WBE90_10980 [Xanthobacteraceae bacterium]
MIDTPTQAKRCTSFEGFRSFMASPANRDADIAAFEAGLLATARPNRWRQTISWLRLAAKSLIKLTSPPIGMWSAAETFTVSGYCAVCDREAAFLVDYQNCFATAPDGRRLPHWRERLVCPHCHLSNRMRAAVGFLLSASNPDATVYLTEFVTPLFQVVASKRKRTIGSEYLRDGTARGATRSDRDPFRRELRDRPPCLAVIFFATLQRP